MSRWNQWEFDQFYKYKDKKHAMTNMVISRIYKQFDILHHILLNCMSNIYDLYGSNRDMHVRLTVINIVDSLTMYDIINYSIIESRSHEFLSWPL